MKINKQDKFMAIENGRCKSTTGFKQLVFSPEGELRPVLYAVYSGPQPGCGTVQGAQKGDIILRVNWSSKGEDFFILIHNEGQVPQMDEYPIWEKLQKMHPWVEGWLVSEPRGSVWIPRDVIPEDQYLSIRAKRGNIDRFLRNYGLLDRLNVNLFMTTAKADLNLYPRDLDFNPDEYIGDDYQWTGSVVDICRTEQWFGSDGRGTSVPLVIDLNVVHGSNYAHETTYVKEGSPGIVGWENFKYLIKISHGIYEKDHETYGHGIDIWKTGK